MSKVAIVSYDLDHVQPRDNTNVKSALLNHTNVFTTLSGVNQLSAIPSWVTLSLPDTTVLVTVPDHVTTLIIVEEVNRVIQAVGAQTGKVFCAFIDTQDHYLYNVNNG